MTTTSEIDLVERASDGDFAAFEELVGLYRLPLWRFVLRVVGNPDDSNDVIQQVLIQLYRALPTLKDHHHFRAWLFQIARNTCLDHTRAQARQRARIAPTALPTPDDAHDIPDTAPLPDEIFERQETARLVAKAVAALPEQARHIVALRSATDLSFGEIATVLGISESAAKVGYHRAKIRLRHILSATLKV